MGTWRYRPRVAAGSDINLGDLTATNLSTPVPPEATELRTRLAHGPGNRLMNFHL